MARNYLLLRENVNERSPSSVPVVLTFFCFQGLSKRVCYRMIPASPPRNSEGEGLGDGPGSSSSPASLPILQQQVAPHLVRSHGVFNGWLGGGAHRPLLPPSGLQECLGQDLFLGREGEREADGSSFHD